MSDKSKHVVPEGGFCCSFSSLSLVADNPQTCVRAFSFCAENINSNAWKIRCEKMPHRNGKIRISRALTIMELVMAMALITIVFAAVLPQFRVMNNSWDSKRGNAETLQNGRVLMDHISHNLSKAVSITAVSGSGETDGYIEFEDNDGNSLRYEIDTDNYVEFGPVGDLSDLAGPVSSLRFTCYDDNDLDTGITDVNSIRLVNVQAVLTNSAALAQDRTFTTSVYLRTGRDIPCSSDLVGWWRLDEASGVTASDSSGNGNDGTLINMDPANDWVSGQRDGALDFDGWNDYVTCGSDQSLDITDDITIALWLRADDFDGDPDIITKGVYYESYSIWLTSLGLIRFALNNDRLASNATLSTGMWYHIAVTRSSNERKIYVDGQEDTSDIYGSAIGTTGRALTISTSSYPFDGRVDDVRIYDRALEPEEVARLASILRYEEFEEEKVDSDATSITIITPDTDEGDLLIAAVATDGDTSISPPGGEGWTEINVGDYDGEVTLGVWWKLAEVSESSSHQFTWAGSEKAYGWMMRFTGHDSTDPINAWSAGGEFSSTPTSPVVITTVDNCMIVRLGAFDDDDITVDDPGLPSEYTTITMDSSGGSGVALFQDSFETSFNQWTDGGTTDWDRTTSQHQSDNYSAHASWRNTHLTSDNIDMSAYSSFTIDFWYREDDVDNNDDVFLQLYDGGSYDNRFKLDLPWYYEDEWHNYNETIYNSGGDAQYFRNNFRIRFQADGINNWQENVWIDNVVISVASSGTVSGGAGYVMQSSSGDSGTSTFTINSANEARMVTIAIAPAVYTDLDGCSNSIMP